MTTDPINFEVTERQGYSRPFVIRQVGSTLFVEGRNGKLRSFSTRSKAEAAISELPASPILVDYSAFGWAA